jgi:ribose/xylose/arabinose/galactoside ABC-type transport system permease subunit
VYEHEGLILNSRKYSRYKDITGLLVGVLILGVFMSFAAEGFFGWYNLHNVLKDLLILMVVASGMTLVILMGKIDMSAGSVMSLASIVTTLLLSYGFHIVFALLGGLLAGATIGLLNGYLVGVLNLNHFVATFATMSIAKGLALVACNGDIISSESDVLLFIGTGKIFGLFFIVWFAAILLIIMFFISTKTKFGYKIYSIGGSEQVARLSGIKTSNVFLLTYVIAGVLAAVGGIFMAGKANSGNATIGDGYEFSVIATVLIGGTPFEGGKGGLLGTLIGAMFLAILKNGLSMLGFTPAWQYALIGAAILIAIIGDVSINERRKAEEKRRVSQ